MSNEPGRTMDLLAEVQEDGHVRLLAPDVGEVTAVLDAGAAVAPGQAAGVLLSLGRAVTLRVPEGVHGHVVSRRPERVHAPVGHGDVVLEIDPSSVGGAPRPRAADAAAGEGGPVLRAAQGGRFYRRAAPDRPPFVEVGAVVQEGAPVGLLEVMKTFGHVVYRASGGLPARARVVRVLVEDGADIDVGTPLLEVEAAG